MKRRRVVDAISQESDDMPAALMGKDYAVFLGGGHPTEEIGSGDPRPQGLVAELRELGAREHAGDGNAQLLAEVAGHALVVPGQDLDHDSTLAEGFDSAACPQLRWIQEGSKTGEDELLLIADDAVGLFRFDLTPGDSEYAKALRTQRLELGLRPLLRRSRQGPAASAVPGSS